MSYNYDIREFQKRSVILLETVDRVCREHGLTYYIIAGTLLGARRHKGFIPWDDDMDIAMMRHDYDILLENADKWLPEGFKIVDNIRNPRYPKYFAKMEDCSTTLVENWYLGYAGGIYIDIFPLDEVPDNKLLRAFHFYRFNLLRRIEYLLFRDPFKHGHGFESMLIRALQSCISRDWVQRRSRRVIGEFNGRRNCNLVMTHDDGFRAYDKSVFGLPSKVIFEGLEVSAPSRPEGFLEVLYGPDYMTPPPASERRSHFHAYCDLNTPYSQCDFNLLRENEDSAVLRK